MRTSTKDPSEMSTEERIAEIATILARGLSRSRNDEQKQGVERSFTGLKSASKHSCVTQKSSLKQDVKK